MSIALCRSLFRVAPLVLVLWLATTGGGIAPAFGDTPGHLPSRLDPASVPEAYRTPQGLYVTAREALAAVTAAPEAALLIDVRTTVEIIFGGIAAPMTRNIPYLIVDPDLAFDPQRETYKLLPNPDFVKAVANLLAERKLAKSTPIVLYCTFGERSAKAAGLLGQSGFSAVYAMVDGFDPEPGAALGKGWKGAGLPWTMTLSKSQLYVSPSM